MCVAENTLRGVSVELSAVSGQLRRRTQRSFLEKVARPLFRQSRFRARQMPRPEFSRSIYNSFIAAVTGMLRMRLAGAMDAAAAESETKSTIITSGLSGKHHTA